MRRHSEQARSMSRWLRASSKCSRHSESLSGMSRVIPRYSMVGIASVPQDQGGAGRRHRPAEIHRDARGSHLTALAGRIVIAMPAVGSARTVVVDGAPELAHVFDHHGHAMGIALAEVT